ncbi:MAG: hypothetical protein OQK75_13255 [Gammaproteobacteria bacterium]|nr:hypothetical protein [Gammaproteobacteria bacterium]MCW9030128.1 hypothetical protein [Gammaproteobacteria bacterium]
MKKLILLIFVILTSSCSLVPTQRPVTIKELLPVGSILNLTQTLVIPKDRSFIYIANGKVAPLKNYNTVDIYEPYCTFHLRSETKRAQQIEPDQFEVTKITEWEGYHGFNGYMRFASKNIRTGGLIKTSFVNDNNGGPSIVMYATILRLQSNKQPDVKELVCGRWEQQSLAEPLTLEEMKTALGDLIIISNKLI